MMAAFGIYLDECKARDIKDKAQDRHTRREGKKNFTLHAQLNKHLIIMQTTAPEAFT